MKKTLLALAVAGVVAAPAAMAEVTVYGLAHVSINNTSSDKDGDTTLDVVSNSSRVGVKAAEDLGGGLKAIAQMEWGVDMADVNGNNTVDVVGDDKNDVGPANITSRNQIVGLSGGFGTFVVGRHDTPYKMSTGKLDPFSDTAADYNAIIGTPVGLENRADNAIAYLSPDFNGLSFQAAIVTATVDEACAVGPCDDADAADAMSVAVQYNAGPLFVAIAHESFEDAVAGALQGVAGGATVNKGHSGTRLGVGYDAGVAKVGFVYETASDVGKGDDDYTAMLVNATIPLGSNNAIIAEYGTATTDPAAAGAKDLDKTLMAVGVAHNFSKSSSAYVAYGNISNDEVTATGVKSFDTDVLTAGLVVKF